MMTSRNDTMCKIHRSLVFALFLVGCEHSDDFQPDLSDAQPDFGPLDEVELEAPAQPHSVPVELVVGECPGATRLIGVLDHGEQDCSLGGSLPPQWSATHLFEGGSPGVAALLESIPAELERYCAYDYVGPDGQVDSWYGALTVAVDNYLHMDATTLSTDCRGEFEQGDLYDTSVGSELRDAFLTNIGWDMGAQVDLDYGSREAIEVAIVDTVSQTAADDPNIDPASQHGLQMAALVREVHCPAGRCDCLDAVHHVLAMPRDDWSTGPNWVVGGRHGSQGDLAMGIYEAVEAWRERRLASPSTSSPRLVINLSIGWTRLANDGLECARGPHASVLAAMRFASCHGALMVAAAGNNEDELCPAESEGALAPARFEALAAPSEGECEELGYSPQWTSSYPIFAGPGSYRPLVHAVGGVDELDEALINARTDAMPRLAALGANGIADPTVDLLSGTSVAAAVASGTAALLWSYRPELRPDEIMQIIYDAGWDMGLDADFGLSGPGAAVHRLVVCAALDDACAGQGGDCPTPACVAMAPALDGNLSGFATAVEGVLGDPQTSVESYHSVAPQEWPSCDGSDMGTTDLASPQPDVPLCSRCNLAKTTGDVAGDDRLSMTIDPSYAGMITGLMLITVDPVGVRSYRRFASEVIDSLNAQPDPVDVTQVWVDTSNAVSAGLEFSLVDGSTQSNRILVYEL
jgi:hypothetical protein